MPRQRSGAAPRRPTAAPAKKPAPPSAAPQRQSSTTAHPPSAPPAAGNAAPAAGAAPSQGLGLFANMASTAAGVAVGSSIGHAIGGMFGGGSSAAPAESQQTQEFAQQHQVNMSAESQGGACAAQIGDFRKCMDDNQGSLNICGWYLDQLKACQSAASQY